MDPIAPVGSGTTPLVSGYQARGTRPLDPAMLAMLKPAPQQAGTARAMPGGRRGVRGTVVIDGNPTWSALNAAMEGAGGVDEDPLQRMNEQRQARVVRTADNPEGLDEMELRLRAEKRRLRVATLVKNIRLTKSKMGSLGKRIEIYRLDLRSLRATIMSARDGLRMALFNRADPATITKLSANLQRLEVSYGRLERMLGDASAEYQKLEVALVGFEAELSLLLA